MIARDLFLRLSGAGLLAALLQTPVWAENSDIMQVSIGMEKNRAPVSVHAFY